MLKKVRDVLMAAKPSWMSMDYGMEDKMATNDVAASMYWNGAIMRARLKNPDVKFGYHRWMEVVIPISLIGPPALAVRVGFGPQGLPMGMQIAGATGADARVLAIGHAYHVATDWPGRRPLLPVPTETSDRKRH